MFNLYVCLCCKVVVIYPEFVPGFSSLEHFLPLCVFGFHTTLHQRDLLSWSCTSTLKFFHLSAYPLYLTRWRTCYSVSRWRHFYSRVMLISFFFMEAIFSKILAITITTSTWSNVGSIFTMSYWRRCGQFASTD
jgi:hypothetical protein